MKNLLGFIFIPLWIASFLASTVLIIVFNFLPIYPYKYPFNSFEKVEKTMSLSKNHRNLIYIMSDMITGFDITSNLQASPTLSNNFTGFTNYENLVTTNWGTNASVPNIFGGYDYNTYYKNHGRISNVNFKSYMKDAINVLVSAFGEAKWDISCIGNQYYDYDDQKSYWDSNWQTLESDFKSYNVQAINANDISRLLFYQKPDLYKKLKLPYQIFHNSTHGNFIPILPYLSQAKIVDTDHNKFFEIMNESTHLGTIMDKNGNYEKFYKTTPLNAYNSITGFLKHVSDLITYLKQNNIYDNTMIVINSDHGNSVKSPALSNPSYNHSGIDYSAINQIQAIQGGFARNFPTLLVKPYNATNPITYDNNNLYTNTDTLTFIKEYNKSEVDFSVLDNTQDKRYLKQLSDISARSNTYMPSYCNDTLWKDDFIHYLLPSSGYGSKSYLVKNDIYNINNWLLSKDTNDYYSPDNLADWTAI